MDNLKENFLRSIMRFYILILGLLTTWRITHILNGEDGPWDVLVHFRKWLGNSSVGHLLDCFYCLSLWIAAPLAWVIGHSWGERLLLWPALSGGAILLERLTAGPQQPAGIPFYKED